MQKIVNRLLEGFNRDGMQFEPSAVSNSVKNIAKGETEIPSDNAPVSQMVISL